VRLYADRQGALLGEGERRERWRLESMVLAVAVKEWVE